MISDLILRFIPFERLNPRLSLIGFASELALWSISFSRGSKPVLGVSSVLTLEDLDVRK
jgi:hypothetical protein